MLLVSTGLRPGMPLNILQCLGQPSASKGCLGQHVSNVKVENSCHRESIRVILSVGNNQATLLPVGLDLGASYSQKVSGSNISPAAGGPREVAVLTTGEAPVLQEAKLGLGPACWEKTDPGPPACPRNLGCIPRVTSQSCATERTYDLILYPF